MRYLKVKEFYFKDGIVRVSNKNEFIKKTSLLFIGKLNADIKPPNRDL